MFSRYHFNSITFVRGPRIGNLGLDAYPQLNPGYRRVPYVEANTLVVIVSKSDSMHKPMLRITLENTVWKRPAWIPPAMQLLKNEHSNSLLYDKPGSTIP
jgi:hypothetical protein